MLKIRPGSATCGILLAVVVSCSSASIASAGWMVNGSTLAGSKALATTAHVDGVWKFKSAGVQMECSGSTISGVSPQIIAPESGTATTITFSECEMTTESCSVTKTIGTYPLKVIASLGVGLGVKLVFLPQTKTIIADIILTGETCALRGEQLVTGKVTANMASGRDERTSQLVEVATTESSGELKVGSSPGEISGKVLPRLATGAPWSFL